jgi:hypothetical protein
MKAAKLFVVQDKKTKKYFNDDVDFSSQCTFEDISAAKIYNDKWLKNNFAFYWNTEEVDLVEVAITEILTISPEKDEKGYLSNI